MYFTVKGLRCLNLVFPKHCSLNIQFYDEIETTTHGTPCYKKSAKIYISEKLSDRVE